jgi:hypothetical protein
MTNLYGLINEMALLGIEHGWCVRYEGAGKLLMWLPESVMNA